MPPGGLLFLVSSERALLFMFFLFFSFLKENYTLDGWYQSYQEERVRFSSHRSKFFSTTFCLWKESCRKCTDYIFQHLSVRTLQISKRSLNNIFLFNLCFKQPSLCHSSLFLFSFCGCSNRPWLEPIRALLAHSAF
jgi:hypothetical protein